MLRNAITVHGAAVGWFSGVFGAIGQVVSGFISGVVGFFSSIWIGITTVFNNVVALAAMAYNFVIFAPVALIIGLPYVYVSNICRSKPSGISSATFTPVVPGGIVLPAPGILLWAHGERPSLRFGSISGIVGVFSVGSRLVWWSIQRSLECQVSVFGAISGLVQRYLKRWCGWYFWYGVSI